MMDSGKINSFQSLKQLAEGSYTEEKSCSLAWHYRSAESSAGFSCSRDLISELGRYADLYKLKILDGNRVVEVMSAENGKGNAVMRLILAKQYDYILAIGDDATDEEIFELLMTSINAFTIKVGDGITSARYKIDSVNEVVSFIKQLSE
jgi:trehalose 6-phosphate synthase/phosphatase